MAADDAFLDRVEEISGHPLADWQRYVLRGVLAEDPAHTFLVHRARRGGMTSLYDVARALLLEPWRFPDDPDWPRFRLVRIPAALEARLDELVTWSTRRLALLGGRP